MSEESRDLAPEALHEHAEFLSRLARRLIGNESDAADLVQETYVTALEQPPRNRASLRGWLGRVVRNGATNLRRGGARRRDREARTARPESEESHEEVFARLEVQRLVSETVFALPEAQRTAIYLRYYEGLTPTAIGERLGVPVKTVKTRLSRALTTLRSRLDDRTPGGRDVWLAALAPVAFSSPPASAGHLPSPTTEPVLAASSAAGSQTTGMHIGASLLGGLVMKQVSAVLVVLAVAAAVWQVSRPASTRNATGDSAPREPVAAAAPDAPLLAEAVAQDTSREELVSTPSSREGHPSGSLAQAELGALELKLSWADGAPAANIEVLVRCRNERRERAFFHRGSTAVDGVVRFEELVAGPVTIFVSRGHTDRGRSIARGRTTKLSWVLPEGQSVRGKVTDENGRAIAGAELWLEAIRFGWPYASLAARTDEDGSFLVRGLGEDAQLGARADGYLPSVVFEVAELPPAIDGAARGDLREVAFVVHGEGSGIHGVVLDPAGSPVAGAFVHAGPDGGYNMDGPDGRGGKAPEPIPVRSNEAGEFTLPGGYSGRTPIHAQAAGFPTWSGEVQAPRTGSTRIEIRLQAGAVIEGRVLDAEGQAVSGARVICAEQKNGGWYDHAFPAPAVESDEDGRFRLALVPPGQNQLNASTSNERLGRAQAILNCKAGETFELDLVLDRDPLVSGRVVDPEGNPLVGWMVQSNPAGLHAGRWYPRQDKTDAFGEFVLCNTGEYTLEISIMAPGEWFPPRLTRRVEPGETDLEFVVEERTRASGHVTGTLLDERGGVPVDARLLIYADSDPSRGFYVDFDPATGHFSHGPVNVGGYRMIARRAVGTALLGEAFMIESGETTDIGVLQIRPPGRVELELNSTVDLQGAAFLLDRPYCDSQVIRSRDGRMISGDLSPGHWILTSMEDELFVHQEVFVESGKTTQVSVTPEQAFQVLLDLRFPEDETWADVTLTGVNELGQEVGKQIWFPNYFDSATVLRMFVPRGRTKFEARTDTGLSAECELELGGRWVQRQPEVLRLQ